MSDFYFIILVGVVVVFSIYSFAGNYIEENSRNKKGALWRTIKSIVTSGSSDYGSTHTYSSSSNPNTDTESSHEKIDHNQTLKEFINTYKCSCGGDFEPYSKISMRCKECYKEVIPRATNVLIELEELSD